MQESENGRMQKPAKGTIYYYENSINSQTVLWVFLSPTATLSLFGKVSKELKHNRKYMQQCIHKQTKFLVRQKI